MEENTDLKLSDKNTKVKKGELTLKVTHDEKIEIKTAASKRGMPVNAYVLSLVRKDNKI